MKKTFLLAILVGTYLYTGAQNIKPQEQKKDTATQHPTPRHRHETGKVDTTKLGKEKNQGNVPTPGK